MPCDAAAGFDHTHRLHIIQVHHQPRCEIDEADILVRLVLQDLRDAQRPVTDRQRRADVDTETSEQTRLRPCFTRRGNAVCRPAVANQRIGDGELAAQRVAIAHRIDGCQRSFLTEKHDGGKSQRLGSCEPHFPRLDLKIRRQRRGRAQHQVGGEHLAGLLLHGGADAIGEKAHRRHGGDSQHDRGEQYR